MKELKHFAKIKEVKYTSRPFWVVKCTCGMSVEAIKLDDAQQLLELHLGMIVMNKWEIRAEFDYKVFPFKLNSTLIRKFERASLSYGEVGGPVLFDCFIEGHDPIDALLKFNERIWKIFSEYGPNNLLGKNLNGKEFILIGFTVRQ